MSSYSGDATPIFRRHHWIALVPAIALVFSPYFANRIEPRIAGMPFMLGWIVFWVIMTAVLMGIILRIDRQQNANDSDE
ncbi:MAG: DUF3311 domain-containing protein [Gemmatimonadaceae bacterium]